MGTKDEVIYVRVGKDRRKELEQLASQDRRSLSSMCDVLIAEALQARDRSKTDCATGD